MKEGRKTVSIPEELYKKISERAKTTGFGSVDEYVSFALGQIVGEEEPGQKMSEADEAEIKRRLESLGYFEKDKR